MWAQLPLQEGAHRVTTTRSRQFAHVAVQQLTLGEGRAVVQRIHERPLTSRLTVVLDGGPVTITNQEQRELRVEAGAGFLHLEETKLEIDVTTPTILLSLIGSAGEGNREESDVAINGLLSLSASPLISGITGFGLALLADKHPGTSLDARALERMARVMVRELLAYSEGEIRFPERPSTYELALQVIRRDATQPNCSAGSIATELNVSLRNLEREFQQHGQTVRRAVRDARVLHALDLLRDPSRAGLTISQIAALTGFSGGSALAHAMSAVGHASPRSYRL